MKKLLVGSTILLMIVSFLVGCGPSAAPPANSGDSITGTTPIPAPESGSNPELTTPVTPTTSASSTMQVRVLTKRFLIMLERIKATSTFIQEETSFNAEIGIILFLFLRFCQSLSISFSISSLAFKLEVDHL